MPTDEPERNTLEVIDLGDYQLDALTMCVQHDGVRWAIGTQDSWHSEGPISPALRSSLQ
jgi:hypothetical protein